MQIKVDNPRTGNPAAGHFGRFPTNPETGRSPKHLPEAISAGCPHGKKGEKSLRIGKIVIFVS